MTRRGKQRIAFYVPDELHTEYARMSDEKGVTASALYTMALWQFIEQRQALTAMNRLTSDTHEIDPVQLVSLISSMTAPK